MKTFQKENRIINGTIEFSNYFQASFEGLIDKRVYRSLNLHITVHHISSQIYFQVLRNHAISKKKKSKKKECSIKQFEGVS